MTLFQCLSISALSVLFVREVIQAWSTPVSGAGRWLRGMVWLLAAVAIARPDMVQQLAESVGIHRGADLVFYLFVLAFVWVSFYFYSRFVRMQRQLTQLIRCLALQDAQQGPLNERK